MMKLLSPGWGEGGVARPILGGEGGMTLGTPNGTARDWIDKKYGAAIAEAFREAHGHTVRVQVVVRPVPEDGGQTEPAPAAAPLRRAPARAAQPPPEAFAPIPL